MPEARGFPGQYDRTQRVPHPFGDDMNLKDIWLGLCARAWRGARERSHTKRGPGRLHLQGKKK